MSREGWIELEGEWVRPAERPEWGREDAEWWYDVDHHVRPPAADERGRQCSSPGCRNPAWLVFLVDRHRRDLLEPVLRREFRCKTHTYDGERRIIERGRVLVARPRFIKQAESSAAAHRRQLVELRERVKEVCRLGDPVPAVSVDAAQLVAELVAELDACVRELEERER